MSEQHPGDTPAKGTTRRRALKLGAVGAAAVVSIRPALAQTNASILTCEIPVPDEGRAGSYIAPDGSVVPAGTPGAFARSEEHTSELQSLMRLSYAVFCLKKKQNNKHNTNHATN